MRYSVQKNQGNFVIIDTEKDYYFVAKEHQQACERVQLFYPGAIGTFGKIIVTARSIKEYEASLGKIPFDDSFTYVEVGCGLGSFLPSLAGRIPAKQLIGIDFLDYAVTKDLLTFALDKAPHKAQIENMLHNQSIITDPTKVTLLNKMLGEAVHDLTCPADILVDMCGAVTYADHEWANRDPKEVFSRTNTKTFLENRVTTMEKRIPKPNGRMFVHAP